MKSGPFKGRVIGTLYEPSDNASRKIILHAREHAELASAAVSEVTIGHDSKPIGPEAFGGFNLVPADRPGLEVQLGEETAVLRPGPASHHFVDTVKSEAEWSAIFAALDAAGVPYEVVEVDGREREGADEALAKIGRAVQDIRATWLKGTAPGLSVDAIEALIAMQDAKAAQDGVLDWINDGVKDRADSAAIRAAVDAKAAEIGP